MRTASLRTDTAWRVADLRRCSQLLMLRFRATYVSTVLGIGLGSVVVASCGGGCGITCKDGTSSSAKTTQGACSHHGGIASSGCLSDFLNIPTTPSSPTSSGTPTSPTSPPTAADVSLGYSLRLAPGQPEDYQATLTLTWQSGNSVGFTITGVSVVLRDNEPRTVLTVDLSTAAMIAESLGTDDVRAGKSVSKAFTANFSATKPYVGAVVSTSIVDDLGNARTVSLGLARDGFGTTGG